VKKKLKIPKKFKLEYLREIDRNLVLHAMQPRDTAEGYAHYSLYSAPAPLLAKIVYTLQSLTRHYTQALKIRIKVDRKVDGKKGLEREIVEATETLREIGAKWNPKGVKGAVASLDIISRTLKKNKKEKR
jgi:hypothetical protein